MAKPRKKAPSRRAARKNKLPAKEPVASKSKETPTPDASSALVQPLSKNVFQMIIQIIDNADFKGSEVGQVLAVKLELARVAGLRAQDDGK